MNQPTDALPTATDAVDRLQNLNQRTIAVLEYIHDQIKAVRPLLQEREQTWAWVLALAADDVGAQERYEQFERPVMRALSDVIDALSVIGDGMFQ